MNIYMSAPNMLTFTFWKNQSKRPSLTVKYIIGVSHRNIRIFINQSHLKLIGPFEFSRMENTFFKVVLIFFIYAGCILITELRSV